MDSLPRSVGLASIATAAALIASACAVVGTTTTAQVPPNLRPSPPSSLAMVATARGVQIYGCREAANAPGTYAWSLVAPEAELFDASGARIGSHFAGPTWEASDGSRIVGSVRERADAPRADAIPWLLLATTTDGPAGALSRVTQVQRIHTAGGLAPAAAECTQATEGTRVRVPYTADYRFWTAGGAYAAY